MKNKQVAEAFANKEEAHGSNFRTDGKTIWSWFTPIAQWEGKRVIFNKSRYSSSTSAQQTYIQCALNRKGTHIIETTMSVPKGANDLKKFI